MNFADGVVQLLDSATQFKFNLTDQLPVVPVRYVSFAGYRGSRSKVRFDCVTTETQTTEGNLNYAFDIDARIDDKENEIFPTNDNETLTQII